MIIMGIDPGSRTTGYGVIQTEGKKLHYIASGILKFDQIENFPERLPVIYSEARKLAETFSPDEIAFESLIFVKSPTALMKLAQTRGALMAALGANDPKSLFEYAPNLIKANVSGYGHADKEALKKMLSLFLGKREYASHDESDALAIAICHALSRPVNQLRKKL